MTRGILALPPSRLRRTLLRYGYARGYASSRRRDWEYQRTYVHPDVEVDVAGAPDWGLDPDRDYRGFDGYVASITPILDAWSVAEFEIREMKLEEREERTEQLHDEIKTRDAQLAAQVAQLQDEFERRESEWWAKQLGNAPAA